MALTSPAKKSYEDLLIYILDNYKKQLERNIKLKKNFAILAGSFKEDIDDETMGIMPPKNKAMIVSFRRKNKDRELFATHEDKKKFFKSLETEDDNYKLESLEIDEELQRKITAAIVKTFTTNDPLLITDAFKDEDQKLVDYYRSQRERFRAKMLSRDLAKKKLEYIYNLFPSVPEDSNILTSLYKLLAKKEEEIELKPQLLTQEDQAKEKEKQEALENFEYGNVYQFHEKKVPLLESIVQRPLTQQDQVQENKKNKEQEALEKLNPRSRVQFFKPNLLKQTILGSNSISNPTETKKGGNRKKHKTSKSKKGITLRRYSRSKQRIRTR
jgi:hypothetical protein